MMIPSGTSKTIDSELPATTPVLDYIGEDYTG